MTSQTTIPAYPVYAVEDSPQAWLLLEHQLEQLGRTWRIFENSAAFLAEVRSLAPGIVVLDINLPDMSGLEMLDEVPEESGPFAVIVASGSDEMNHAIGAFRRGAIDFLRKPCPIEKLQESMEEADASIDAQIETRDRKEKAAKVRLSRREQEILEAMARGHQSKVIAYDLDISVRTVEMHRSNIIAKLEAQNASHALTIAQNLGLI